MLKFSTQINSCTNAKTFMIICIRTYDAIRNFVIFTVSFSSVQGALSEASPSDVRHQLDNRT